MTPDEFIKQLEERGDAIYILDRGLVRFGKFAVAILAMFILVGAFFFGLDIKKASEEAKDARFETEKTLSEINEIKRNIATAQNDLNRSRDAFTKFVTATQAEMKTHLEEAAQSSKRTLGIEQQVILYQLQIKQYGDDARALLPAVTSTKGGQRDIVEQNGQAILVALVSEVKEVGAEDLALVAKALQKQVTRDLAPIWNITATIEPFPALDQVPKNYWPIIIKRDINMAGAAGFHSDQAGQPFAVVQYSTVRNDWTLTTSHELLDMLVDPLGRRMINVASPDPADKGKVVGVLVEIATPVETADCAYSIDGVLVSDFVTPAFFALSASEGVKYSFNGSAKSPMKILKNGYMSWIDAASQELHQVTWFGNEPVYRSIGKVSE
jgi:preprotein translocase subunit SecE